MIYSDLIYFGDIIKVFSQPMENLVVFLLVIVRSLLFEISLHEKFATNGKNISHKVLVSEKVFNTLDSIMAHLFFFFLWVIYHITYKLVTGTSPLL